MLCAKSIVDLCKSRAALKQGSSFSNIVLTNWPGRVIYVHTKKERQVCAMITEIDFIEIFNNTAASTLTFEKKWYNRNKEGDCYAAQRSSKVDSGRIR